MSSYKNYESQIVEIQPKILSYFLSKVDLETAEELKQETFLRGFQFYSSFDSKKGTFSQWMFSIAKNVFVKYLSSKFLNDTILDFDIVDTKITIKDEFDKKNFENEIKKSILRLSIVEQRIVKGKYRDNKTLSEIADELNISSRTVSRKYSKALDLLRVDLITKGIRLE